MLKMLTPKIDIRFFFSVDDVSYANLCSIVFALILFNIIIKWYFLIAQKMSRRMSNILRALGENAVKRENVKIN